MDEIQFWADAMRETINVQSSNFDNIKVGEFWAKHSASGDRILRYYMDFRHTVLDLHKEVSAPEVSILQNKVDTLMAAWDKKFETFTRKASLAVGKETAEDMMTEAEEKRSKLGGILHHTLSINDAVDWEVLKDHSKFKKIHYNKTRPSDIPELPEPILPKIGFFQILFGQRKRIESEILAIKLEYTKHQREIEEKRNANLENWRKEMAKWNEEQAKNKEMFYEKQMAANAKVDNLKTAWINGSIEAVIEHANIVLEASEYDDLISKEFEIQYDNESKTLLIDYMLPSPDNMPTIKNVRFVASTGELRETQVSASEKRALFDDMCYQICLRTIHELFEADLHEHIQTILFNGSANYVDKATGQEVNSTILSLMVSREEFVTINLSRIEPKACFKSLKGVSAASLIGLTPIAPIMELNRVDKRFVDAQQVNLGKDGSTNLAAMDWEDFEHLIREIFAKEFSSRGGEVKITQSSSDGGVDAIAFDPDQISGGKIIIQAKRYTRTVGVAAVRDLYGTTMNEGANKGILITTSDYGPDAYKFAAEKPLTLMNGGHLLHLLKKHGIIAKIDLREARRELGLKETNQ